MKSSPAVISRALAEHDLPDLLMVDGGKGQLGVAVTVLRELGITESRCHWSGQDADRAGPVCRRSPLIPPSASFCPVARIRSFSSPTLRRSSFCNVSGMRPTALPLPITGTSRAKERLSSPLEAISGVGPAKRKALLRHFGSLKRVRDAAPGSTGPSRGDYPDPGRKKYTSTYGHTPPPR